MKANEEESRNHGFNDPTVESSKWATLGQRHALAYFSFVYFLWLSTLLSFCSDRVAQLSGTFGRVVASGHYGSLSRLIKR